MFAAFKNVWHIGGLSPNIEATLCERHISCLYILSVLILRYQTSHVSPPLALTGSRKSHGSSRYTLACNPSSFSHVCYYDILPTIVCGGHIRHFADPSPNPLHSLTSRPGSCHLFGLEISAANVSQFSVGSDIRINRILDTQLNQPQF